MARSHGLVAKAEDSQLRGRTIESLLARFTSWNVITLKENK